MKFRGSFFIYTLIIIATTILFCTVQTVIWPLFFNNLPSPMIWLSLLIYISIYRKPWMSFILGYLILSIVINFSAISVKMLFLSYLTLYGWIYLIKSRIFWSGPFYFMLMNIIGCLWYQVFSIIASYFLDPFPTSIFFFWRSSEILLTSVASLGIYRFLVQLDQWLFQDWVFKTKAET